VSRTWIRAHPNLFVIADMLKKLGLEKMLMGHYETYNIALVLCTVNTTPFCIFIPVYITRATVLYILTLQIVS